MRRLVALLVVGGLASGTAYSGGVARPGAAPWSEGLGDVLVFLVSPIRAAEPEREGPDLTGLLLVHPQHQRGIGVQVTVDTLDARLSEPRRRARDAAERANRARYPLSEDDLADRARRFTRLQRAGVPGYSDGIP